MRTRYLMWVWPAILSSLFAISTAAQNAPPGPAASPAPAAETAGATTNAATAPAAPAGAPATANSPDLVAVPTGTHLLMQLENTISTQGAQPGDAVYFRTSFPVVVDDRVVIPVGSYVSGELTHVKRPGRVKGKGEFMVRLTTLIFPNGYQARFGAIPANAGLGGGQSINREGKVTGPSDKKGDAGTIITTTAAGAEIGAIAGLSPKGAGIGAGVGAAAGLAMVLLTRGPEAELRRGTPIDTVLDRPLYLDAARITGDIGTPPRELSAPPEREGEQQRRPF